MSPWAFTQLDPSGCRPCGPPFIVDGTLALWHVEHSERVPACPWSAMLWRLSFTWDDGYSAWVEPWQAAHWSPPWPVEKR